MGQPWLKYLVIIISLCSFRSCLTSPQCDRYQDQAGKVGLNCSHRSLQSVPPSLPEDTQVLLLSSNSISSVSLGSFGNLLRLHDLDLSDNRLERLEGDRPLPLQWLNLSSNALTTIPHLGNLPHLRKLVLDGNRIADLHQGAFGGLVKLTELSIRGNAIDHVPDRIFHPLHNLQHLNLASNRIQDFPNGALDMMEELVTLDVSNNSLRAIPKDLFENNPFLLYVYLYSNPWHCECGTANYLKVWMDDNDGNVYRYVGEPDSESVVCASPAVWQGWPIINLTHGQLCPVSTTQATVALSLPTPPPWAVCNSSPGLDGKVGLNCSHRSLQSVPPSLPEDTQVLLLSSNSISSVSLGSFENLSKLRHLNLADNRLGRFEGDRPLPLEWLDLSSNALTTVPHLGNLTHLRKLVLDGNRIADLHQGAFDGLVNLTELSIRGNAIGHVPDRIFHPLHNLRHLNLASNRIQDFPNGALDRMKELKALDVSNNSLRAIPTDLFVNNTALLYVYLYDNPWHCECGTANYLKGWMDDNGGSVYRYVGKPDSESVVCASPAVWQGWPIVNLTLGQLCPISTTQTPAALSLPTPPPWAVCDPSPGLAGVVGLNCSHRSLQSVPPSLPEDTQVLLLSSNSISSVSLGSFGNLSKLRQLDLSDNRLGRFEGDRPLPLEWLDLSSNALTTIPHLGNLTHLRKLVLDGNRIADLHQGAFEGLVNLTELSIRGNAIGHVPDRIFHPLHNLRLLNLASNRIQDFPNGALDGLEELKALDVSNNSLRAIPTDLFVNNAALLYVYLYDNPWHCECATANYLKGWMDDNGGSVYRYVGKPDSESVVCASPAVWQGWPIVNLTLGELCPVSTTQTPAALSLPTPPPWAVCDPSPGLAGVVGLNCSHRSLQSVPPSLPEDTQVLLLSSNSISSVSLGSFGNLSKLRQLDLSDNRLGRFEGDRPLPLEWLDLSSNALTTIPHLGNLTHLRKLVLDGNRIADLHQGAFEGLVNLTELSIRGNAIGHVPDRIFHPLHNLRLLNLASNRIQDFPNGALDGLEELKALDVSNNSLRAIPTDLFVNNTALLYVYLYNNPWHCECGTANYLKGWMDDNGGSVYRYVGKPDSESVVCASPAVWQGWPIVNLTLGQLCPVSTTQTPAALSLPTPPPWAVCDPSPGLAGVVGLNCSHRSLQSVPPSLPEDTQVLLLSSNSISSVSLGSFGNLSKLRQLDLSDNRLGRFEGDRPLPLEWLDLSSNALTTIPHLGNLTHLRKLVLDGNRIADLHQGAFDGLVNLTELSIRGNAIGHVPDRIFHPLHNLRLLNLASNRIQDFPNVALDGLEELKALDVSNNSLRAIPTDLFVNNTALLYVYLYNNPWHCECGTANYLKGWMDDNGGSVYRYVGKPDSESVVCASPAVWQGWPIVNLTLGQLCPVSTTQMPVSLSLPSPPPWAVCDPSPGLAGEVGLNCSHRSLQSVPPSLPEDTQVLLLSSNSISSVSLGSFGNLSKLRYLDLSDNRLGRFEGDRPLPLEWLDLSSNALTTIPHLGNLTHLRVLVLDGNRIVDLHQGAFEGLVNLTELSIRGNAIGHVPDRIFHPLHNLQHLNIASNHIQDFPNGALEWMKELVTLDVSNNSLRVIPTDLFVNNTALLYVYLYDNPWHCECGTANYLKGWMDDNGGSVYRYAGEPDSESVVCASPAVWQGWPIVNLTLGQLCPVSTTQTPVALSLPTPPPWAVCDPSPGFDGKVGLNCSHRSLQSVPPSLPEDTQVLLLSSNSISSVSLGSFGNLSKLHYLDLSDNRLGRFEGDRPLPLEWLDLSSNALTTIPHLGNLPHLRKLVLDDNRIADLHQGAFEGLVNLTELSIRGNAIGHVPDRIFHPLHNLRHLNLASNRIQDFPNVALEWMKELKALDVSNNSLRAIPTDLFVNNTALLHVYLFDNPWHCECGTANYLKGWMDDNGGSVYRYAGEPDSESVVCASPAVWQGWPIINLTLGQLCPVSTTQTPATLPLPTPPPWAVCDPSPGLAGEVGLNCSHRSLQSVPPSLPEDTQVLLLSSNSISSVSLGSFGNLSKLRHLDLSDNRLGRFEGDCPLPLEWLDLSSNALTTIPHLGNLTHLRELVLDGNRIADLHQGAFEGLVNLTELSIRGNAIGHLPDRIFHPLHNLRLLNLASNRIQDFPNGALDGLEELDVSENLLSSLPPSLLGNAAPLQLALHGNPWVCDGRNHHLSRWIRANPGKVRGPNGAADDNAAVCSAPLQLNGVPLVRVPLQSRCPSEPPASSPPSPVAAKPVDDAITAWARMSGLLLDGRASRPSCWPQLLLHCFALSLVAVELCTLFFYTLGFYRRLYRPLKRLGRGVRLVRYSLVLPVYPPPGPHPNPDLRLVEPLLADEGDAGSATQGEAYMLTSFQ